MGSTITGETCRPRSRLAAAVLLWLVYTTAATAQSAPLSRLDFDDVPPSPVVSSMTPAAPPAVHMEMSTDPLPQVKQPEVKQPEVRQSEVKVHEAKQPELMQADVKQAETVGAVTQASCSSCGNGGGLLGLYGGSGGHGGGSACGSCGGCNSGQCYPGRKQCNCCEADTHFGRFLCGLYDCICCPDPCYEPKWMPIADSAFFTEAARPQTQTRLRWDSAFNVSRPDRAEYFWARSDGNGKGPKPAPGQFTEQRLKYNDLMMYTEAATGLVGAFFETPYRSLDPDNVPHAAGFADMNVGVKTLIFDCELIQVAMQMKTYIPVGNALKGLGTGHVSLEPSLIVGIRIHEDTYLQMQVAEWIPLGGDINYAGAALHYHTSLNHVLCRILPDVPLIGTVEFSGISFQDGAYTDPVLGAFQKAGDYSYFCAGGGMRLFVCDRIDFGVSASFALTEQHLQGQTYRSEFRFRF